MNIQAPKTDIINTLVQTVKQDVELLEKSGQWVFSSYSPAKECASIPGIGLDDISPEEMRFEAYTAKLNNTLPAFQQTMQNLVQTYANIRQQLLNPSPSIKEALRKLYKDDSNQNKSVFGGGSGGGFGSSSTGSLFGGSSNVSNTSGGLFGGGGNNAFGGTSQATSGQSIFGGGAMSQGSSNLFGGGSSQTLQSGSIFGGSSMGVTKPGGSVFGASSTPSNPFASFQQQQPHQQTSIFSSPSNSQGSNIFSSVQPPQTQGSVFGQTSSLQQPLGGIFSSNNASNPGGGNGLFGVGNAATPVLGTEAEGMNEEILQEPSIPVSQKPLVEIPPTNISTPVLGGNNIFQTSSSETPSSNIPVKTGLFGQILRTAEDPSKYSKMEDLTQNQIEVFKSKNFLLGQIPEVPPPRELCV